MLQGIKKSTPFRQQIAKPAALPPTYHSWYWHPNRVEVRKGPADFTKRLHAFHPDLEVTWNPIRERWCVWVRKPRLNHPVCQGWQLLFFVEHDGAYAPLDNRVLAKLYERSGMKWGNLYEYWLRIEREMERDREKLAADRADSINQGGGEYFQFTQIKNIGKGNKFSEYHTE